MAKMQHRKISWNWLLSLNKEEKEYE